jgi:hypothetical protein
LLEAIARERTVKTKQIGKGLMGSEMIYELWKLAVAL